MPISFPNRASAAHISMPHTFDGGYTPKSEGKKISPYILRSAEKKKEWREV